MKKKTKLIIIIITSVVLLGTILRLTDYSRVKQNKKPLFMINLRNKKDKPIAISENSVSCGDKEFELSLNTDKKIYKTTDKINIWSTLKYVGEKEEIKIYHAGDIDNDTYLYYTIDDGKYFRFETVTNLMLKTTDLIKNKLYRHNFVKSGSWHGDDPKAKFWEDFFQEKDLYLPEGEYVITSKSAFSAKYQGGQGPDLTCKLNIKVEK